MYPKLIHSEEEYEAALTHVEILNRKRSLSLSMIRALHSGLGIPAEILVREPDPDYKA